MFVTRCWAGIHFTGSTAVFRLNSGQKVCREPARGIAATPVSSARPVEKISSSRTPRPSALRWRPHSCGVASNTRGRSAPPPPASTSRARCGRASNGSSTDRADQGRAGHGLYNFMGAVIDKKAFDRLTSYQRTPGRRRDTPSSPEAAAARSAVLRRAHARRVRRSAEPAPAGGDLRPAGERLRV